MLRPLGPVKTGNRPGNRPENRPGKSLTVQSLTVALLDRDMPPGAEPEELMAMKVPALIIPGDDPSHATSGAHYLHELLPRPEFWTVMPPEQTPERVRDRIIEFGRAHK